MAVKPQIRTLTNSSVDVLNVIRNNASQNYQNYVPVATADADSIRQIGAIIMDFPALQNEFLSALVNRIGLVIMKSRMYSNPIAMFKKGILEFGETIEEIFVELAKPFQYDPAVAENKVFARNIPNVRSAFHILNYQKFYKSTVQQDDLRKAFLSWNGVNELIAGIVDSMYTAANYDEFLTMKYMLARNILNGRIKITNIPAVSAENAKAIVSEVKGVSNAMTFMNTDYNPAGVHTHSTKDRQYVLLNSRFDAIMDVEVLAAAFNMDKAQFVGKRVLVDGFGKLDIARLNELFADDPTYVEISQGEMDALNAVPCIIVDEDYFMVYDNMIKFTEQYNGEGLYWNYWYHTWKTFSVSPFAQAGMFLEAVPTVTKVTVTPEAAGIKVGGTIALGADVETTNFAPQTVVWSITSGEKFATVDVAGVVRGVAAGEVTVRATSTFDPAKYAEATITVA